MADAPAVQHVPDPGAVSAQPASHARRPGLLPRWRLFAAVLGGLLLVCLFYCLLAPNTYEAKAELALRTSPASALSLDTSDVPRAASTVFGDPRQETLANVLRTDQLAWRVILDRKLYQSQGFSGRFAQQFP